MSDAVCHYFVDEAGDPVLFSRRGRVLVGTEGCSRFFILGLAQIADPVSLGSDLQKLRATLLADPYFAGVPSMQPESRKTALCFHAKDDLPEVRREVFALLKSHEMRFFAVVRDKLAVLEYVRRRGRRHPGYRYKPTELYDSLARRLVRDRLHKAERYRVVFAQRWRSDRTAAFESALHSARKRFEEKWGMSSSAPIQVVADTPANSGGLQATDYFLWALQRLLERREDRYTRLLWPAVGLIHDVDDTREPQYGVYYTQKRPISTTLLREM